MNTNINNDHPDFSNRRARARFGLMASIALVLVAFTATTLDAYVRTGGSGRTVVFGEIEDFGSIVVNGVHYDESAANIIIDGIPGQSRAALKLGMIVQIDGVLDYTLNTGVANEVRVDRALFGQVEEINSATSEVTILKQRVLVSTTTRFDGVPGLHELAVGDWIAVHGLEDAGRKSLVATLIERSSTPSLMVSSIRGTVQNVQRGRLRIGNLDILVGNSNVHDGDFVKASGEYLGGVLLVEDVVVTRKVEIHESVETLLQGYVADFRGIGAFTIDGVMIDASTARYFGGRANDLHQDVRVTVEGSIQDGVLIAEEVLFPGASSTDVPTESGKSIELEGIITAFTSIADFVVKGRHIDASNINLKDGKQPKLGWKAHVEGNVTADGIIKVTKAKFERP
ncbi:MAG: DUF5666 domain-containing protein [Pseudomonadota bacterium]